MPRLASCRRDAASVEASEAFLERLMDEVDENRLALPGYCIQKLVLELLDIATAMIDRIGCYSMSIGEKA